MAPRNLPAGSFAFAPASLWADTELGKTALRVGLYIATFANKKGECWRSASTMAKALGYRRNTVMDALDELLVRGHADRIRQPGRPSTYVLKYLEPTAFGVDEHDPQQGSGDVPHEGTGGDRQERSGGDPHPDEHDPQQGSGVTPSRGHKQYESEERDNPNDEVEEARAIFDELASRMDWPRCSRLTLNWRNLLTARLRECGGLDGWRHAMQEAARSNYLRRTRPDLGFFLREDNFAQLMNGRYGPEFDREVAMSGADAAIAGARAARAARYEERGLTAALRGLLAVDQ